MGTLPEKARASRHLRERSCASALPRAACAALEHALGALNRAQAARRTLKGLLTLPLAWQANRAVRAREQLRYHAMRALTCCAPICCAWPSELFSALSCPEPDSIWELTIDEVLRLDDGWAPDAVFFAERTAEIARLKRLPVPDLLHRFDDLERDLPPEARSPRLRGISLTVGEVVGRAWVLHEPTQTPPPFEPPVIAVARSVDVGWLPIFAQVQGAVVETGGDLSHGSIILRDLACRLSPMCALPRALIQNGELAAPKSRARPEWRWKARPAADPNRALQSRARLEPDSSTIAFEHYLAAEKRW